ncbi:Crp/Fnr family transcriptional regulator [Algoriphagus halophilus]|uniref:CRP/FNR family transcriptional regulator, anaerobic regulatory protein n=1 Tax=Algoriphagus halophilus TaxID=226505 RepID=A0A1N6DAV0_9BACT|nr:Crp/Fnr family transcriptional regulator [Algoriphagus halophilus]SIN67928.1 CRP/FNR family transcriptional regulator, anaerobic regulatory protein [Algoriphagus halophilus]
MSGQSGNTPCELCASRKLSLFADLPEQHVCTISDNKNLISHKKGQILYYEGTKPLGIFCINSGVVKVYKTASNGKEQIIHLSQKGDFLGYSALLGEENYTNSAMIVEDAKICFIPKEAFLTTLFSNTPFFKRITKALSHELGVMEEKLTDATQKSIRERLAFVLLQLGSCYGVEGGESQKIDLVLSREEIASMVGTATESVIRLLSEFKKDNLIALEGKRIVIKDRRGLARLSDFYA